MGIFDSIFGIDIFGTGKPGFLDDAVILGALEEEDNMNAPMNDDYNDEDEAIESGAIDEDYDL